MRFDHLNKITRRLIAFMAAAVVDVAVEDRAAVVPVLPSHPPPLPSRQQRRRLARLASKGDRP